MRKYAGCLVGMVVVALAFPKEAPAIFDQPEGFMAIYQVLDSKSPDAAPIGWVLKKIVQRSNERNLAVQEDVEFRNGVGIVENVTYRRELNGKLLSKAAFNAPISVPAELTPPVSETWESMSIGPAECVRVRHLVHVVSEGGSPVWTFDTWTAKKNEGALAHLNGVQLLAIGTSYAGEYGKWEITKVIRPDGAATELKPGAPCPDPSP
jgi:hypothetical protein